MNKDDLKLYIYENNLIQDILEYIGLTYVRPVGDKYYSCGFPESRRRDSINCYMNENLTVKVWSRNEDIQDLYGLIKYQMGVKFPEAISIAAEVCGVRLTNRRVLNIEKFMKKPKKKERIFEKPKVKKVNYKTEDCFVRQDCEIFLKDGIDSEAQEYFKVCYDPLDSRVVFPLRDFETGDIISFKGRTIDKDFVRKGIPKYMYYFPFDGRWNLFGLYENYYHILDNEYLIIVESEKAVMQLYSMGIRNVVAVSKKRVSDEQAYILNKLNKKIIIAFDEDVDEFEIMQQCKKFNSDVYYIYSKNKIDKKCSPTDFGYEVFTKLYNNKIKYEG